MVVTQTSVLNTLLQCVVSLLRCREPSGLQRRRQGVECLGQNAIALQGARSVFAQGAEIRLGLGEVPRLQILPQLLKLTLNLLCLRLPGLQALTQRTA